MTAASVLPRFRQARSELAVLAARERWPRERLAAYQLERLNALWSHAIAEVPHYRRLRAELALPAAFVSLDEFRTLVPVLPKSAVRDHPGEFLSESRSSGSWHRTSGSTGAPMRIFWEGDARREALRCQYRLHASWGVDLFDRSTYVMGPPTWSTGAKGFVERAKWKAACRLRQRQWLFVPRPGRAEIRATLARIARFRPAMLYGYSNTLQLLAMEAEATGVRWKELRVVFLTSEPASAALRDVVSRGFRVPTAIEYGATECPLIAGEGPTGGLRVREDIAIVETPRREDSRRDIVLTVLINRAFPLLRYQTGDLTESAATEPACGFATLNVIYGRDDDYLVARNGDLVDSTALDVAVHAVGGVRAFRASQATDGAITLWLEPAESVSPTHFDRIRRNLELLVGGHPVLVQTVDAVPVTPAGKLRVVTSELARRLDDASARWSAPSHFNGWR